MRLDVPQIPSVPLGDLASKYTAAQLTAFLVDPLASWPTARMPRIALQLQEAADLAAYLIRQPTPPEPALAVDKSLAERGKGIFASSGCAACHDVYR